MAHIKEKTEPKIKIGRCCLVTTCARSSASGTSMWVCPKRRKPSLALNYDAGWVWVDGERQNTGRD